MAGTGVTVTASGPLFDGLAPAAVQQFLSQAIEDVVQEGEIVTRALGWQAWRNPTGFYASQIIGRRTTPTQGIIWDQNVIYGPWLEGVGSRNATSRFKGYSTFRQATQAIQIKVPTIVQSSLKLLTTRLGG